MNKLYINSFVEKKLSAGVQLLEERDFKNLNITDQVVTLVSKGNQIIGVAYLSKQHRGVGWFLGQHADLTSDYFCQLFLQAKAKRRFFINDETTNAYRIFNQEGDNFGGLTIDFYNDFAVFSWYNTFVFQLKKLLLRLSKRSFLKLREHTVKFVSKVKLQNPYTFMV